MNNFCCRGCDDSNGNYTYWRFASSNQGDNIAKTPNESGIKRCWAAVVTSDKRLDEESPTFYLIFANKWYNICESECSCKRFDYHKPGLNVNSWIFNSSTIPNIQQDNSVLNKIAISGFIDGTISTIAVFQDQTDNINKLLQSNEEYCFEFIIENNIVGDDYYVLSFGDGAGVTDLIIDSNFISGFAKGVIKAVTGGGIDASTLKISYFNPTNGNSPSPFLKITDFRLSTRQCCDLSLIKIEGENVTSIQSNENLNIQLRNSEDTDISSKQSNQVSGEDLKINFQDETINIILDGELKETVEIPIYKNEDINISWQ